MSTTLPPTTLKPQALMMSSPWFRFFLDYDPVPALKKTECPVLALNGGEGLQMAPKENLAQIQKALQEGGNQDFQTKELPGLNHLFQHAPTGSPTEYGGVEETIAPHAPSAMVFSIPPYSVGEPVGGGWKRRWEENTSETPSTNNLRCRPCF